ncbi:hypothetical protein BGZ60DRAFT_435658 [Tricladium varicosporioides]|nr:hypothetical protein BGZ60DRAFT_435658 [Hymenoscyphus varicosporioides]
MSLYPNISTWGLPLHGNLQAFASYGGFVTQDVDSLAKQRVQGMRHKRISPLETRDFPDRRGGQPGLIGSPSPHHVYNEAVESVDAPENMDDMLPADPVFLVILSLVKPPELTPGYRFWTMLLWFWDDPLNGSPYQGSFPHLKSNKCLVGSVATHLAKSGHRKGNFYSSSRISVLRCPLTVRWTRWSSATKNV